MKKTFLLTVILLLSNAFLFAQQNYQDVVYLKNGSIIRGIITEQVPNQSIKIETADGNVFVYAFSDIEKMTREAQTKANTNNKKVANLEKTKGYTGIVDAFYGFGFGEYKENFVGITMVNAYKFNPYLSMGIGAGVKYYTDQEMFMIPLFADFRATLMDNNIAPFVAIGIGASAIAEGDFSIGFFFNPHVGVHFRLPDSKMGLNISVGYETQGADVSYYNPIAQGRSNVSTNLGAISLKLGFSF